MSDPAPLSDSLPALGADLVPENVYGSRKRLNWILRYVGPSDAILEVGCGTGHMLCRPLARLGYRVQGIDRDATSINYGKELLRAEGLDPQILSVGSLSALNANPSVIIASEVLEHLNDEELRGLLADVRARLRHHGTFLVTVPNGYGWFEIENFVWRKLRVGDLLFRLGFCHLVESTKARFLGPEAVDAGKPSTLADSPHVQRFTLLSITRLLRSSGFDVMNSCGSVAFCGPFSNLFFAGFQGFLDRNARWGDRLGPLASGYFLACRVA
jgi:SAM-dependent methyltransferase